MSETKCLGDNHKVLVTDLTESKSLIGSLVLHSIRREMLTEMKSLVGLNDSYTLSHSMK